MPGVISDVGARLPVYCTSQGKVFLAAMQESERQKLLAGIHLVQYTPHTITDLAELNRQLRQMRADGYAIENGEYKIGLRSISAPVYTIDGKLKYRSACSACSAASGRRNFGRRSSRWCRRGR